MGRAFEYRKATKMKRWASMAKAFTRVGKQIAIAVKESGPDPATNPKLRAAIQNAKAANMPKENVERAIKKATSKDQEDYKELIYEGYGPHGIAVLVECATDNPTRTVANVRSYFNKYHGSLGTSGSVDYLFEHKCFFRFAKPEGVDMDELELEMIDFGGEELGEEEDQLAIYGAFESFGTVQDFLEGKGIEVLSSGFVRIPTLTKELTPEQIVDMEKLLDRLDEDEDVSEVFTTMA
ncbi:MAG: YebC/PmpR family DNA-binding transcriptional regulator [Saprospiraceae bacterium]|jgi:YebC/PmpR family DNA-binding regulatory protein|nr:YebC/PmpR family DNA-binding transcriptional regulator [Saprospiraceae bacterium]